MAERDTLGVVDGGLEERPLPAPGFVRFRAVHSDKMGLVAELNGTVKPTGYGEHDVTDRPGDVGITSYKGRAPLALAIPLLLDRWSERKSVEAEVRMLERMLGLDSQLDQPPTIIVEGFGVPHSYTRAPQNRFVLSGDPDWGEERFRGTDGHRSYVEVAVTARLLVRPETIEAPGAGGSSSARRYYTVPRTGHPRTLRGIAKKRHVDWRRLRQLNPRLPGDPDHGLRGGTKVRVA